MLYGMEEFDDEFGLIKQEKLNIKKVGIVIAIIAVILIIVFYVFITSKNKENQYAQGDVQNHEQHNSEVVENKNNEKNYEDNETEIQENMQISTNINSISENHNQIPEHNMESIEKRNVPVANENAHTLIKDIYFSDEKQVYLTFDDGPSKDITPQILDILKENDVKATFFVLGARVELYPDKLKREFDEGHYIANHGYSHDYKLIYQNKDTVWQEYVDCENAIKNALGNQDYNSYLFRFPGGSSGGKYSKIKAEAKEHFKNYGVANTNWNCLTGDAEGKKTKEDCMQKMLETKGDQNSIILLMHDANDKQQTVDVLPEIIQYYKNEGYTFKTFYEIFK